MTNQFAAIPDLDTTGFSDFEDSASRKIAAKGRVSPISGQSTREPAIHQLNIPQLFEVVMNSSVDGTGLLFDTSNPPMDMFTTVISFDQSFQPGLGFRSETITIPRSPKSNQHHLVDYFLKYHLEVISPSHYFWYYDYIQLCKRWLPAMAATSLALRHALVAFSALVYSIKVIDDARQIAYFYYAMALKELRVFLDGPLSSEECNIAIAIALQLSTFEVHFFPLYVVLMKAFPG